MILVCYTHQQIGFLAFYIHHFFVQVYNYLNYKVAYLFVFLYLTLILSIEMVPLLIYLICFDIK